MIPYVFCLPLISNEVFLQARKQVIFKMEQYKNLTPLLWFREPGSIIYYTRTRSIINASTQNRYAKLATAGVVYSERSNLIILPLIKLPLFPWYIKCMIIYRFSGSVFKFKAAINEMYLYLMSPFSRSAKKCLYILGFSPIKSLTTFWSESELNGCLQ